MHGARASRGYDMATYEMTDEMVDSLDRLLHYVTKDAWDSYEKMAMTRPSWTTSGKISQGFGR
jgi:hypothetical protein